MKPAELHSLSKLLKMGKAPIVSMDCVKPVNLFDLPNYVKLNPKGFELIKEKIKYKNLSYHKIASATGLTRQAIGCFIGGEKSIKSCNLLKLINFLQIDEKIAERHVLGAYSSPYQAFQYNFNFPIEVGPLHIRLISHILGDGCLERNGARWYQKSEVGGKKFMTLVYSLCNRKITKNKKDSYMIPAILMDVICAALNLSRNDLKTNKLIDSVLNLPREYRIQLLAALIVDEGTVYKSSIKISNTNFALLKSLRKLILSLGYSCTGIKKTKNNKGEEVVIRNSKSKVNANLKAIFINADGLKKFSNDIGGIVEKYGNVADLWQKQKKLEEQAAKVDIEKLIKRRQSIKELIPLIEKKIRKEPVKVSQFAKTQNINYTRAYKIFFRLKKRGKIRKIGAGLFASNSYNGPVPETLGFKIAKHLEEGQITVKELARLTKGNPKSISTQLSKFYTDGIVKRIKRGFYQLA